MDDNEQLEREVADILSTSGAKAEDPSEAARKRLIPKYEIRVQTQLDPIVEETLRFRKLAKEVDSRYDKYLSRIPKTETGDSDGEK
jgi:hypothetical protein